MRVLLINPNTTQAVTDRVLAAARVLAPDISFTAATGRFGASYISSRAAYAIGGHAALDALAAHGTEADAVILACFGDPGIDALKEMSRVPVVGMAEAALHSAMLTARRFSIVTGGAAWKPMLEDYARGRGLESGLASVRVVRPTGASLMAAPQSALTLLREACVQCMEQDGAQAVIIGGAGLVGYAALLRQDLPIPVIDGLEASIAVARTIVTPGRQLAPLWCEPVGSLGLSDELSGLLALQVGKAQQA